MGAVYDSTPTITACYANASAITATEIEAMNAAIAEYTDTAAEGKTCPYIWVAVDNGYPKLVCADEHTGGKATCTEKAVCDICGASYGEVDADNHDIVIDEAVAPTCTETGLTEASHCTHCDNATVAQKVVPATNHKDTLVQVEAKAPTCTEIGWDAYEYCTACDYTTYVEIPVVYHIDNDGDYLCDNGCGHEFEKPATPDEPADDVCADCGKVHNGFFSEIICFFTRIINFIKNLFA